MFLILLLLSLRPAAISCLATAFSIIPLKSPPTFSLKRTSRETKRSSRLSSPISLQEKHSPYEEEQSSNVSKLGNILQHTNREVSSRRSILISSSRSSAATLSTIIGMASSNSSFAKHGIDLFVEPCGAITPEQASSSYDTYAKSYDALDGGEAAFALGIDAARNELFKLAKGRVLEVGVGTGLNIERYNFASPGCNDGMASDMEGRMCDGVTSLALVDVSEGMLNEAREKVKRSRIPSHVSVEFVKADATSQLVSLFGRNSFDTVVDTFSLCVMGNTGAANCLKQMRDVVKGRNDGGRILLLENSRSSNPFLGWYQDLTAEAAANAGGKGCVYNQNVGLMIKQSGLTIEREEPFAAGLFRSFICVRE